MTSKDLTIQVDVAVLERLDHESRLMNMSPSEVARTLLEEGLRMEAHPGIVFRPGPAGRRPALRTGPDIWEVISLYEDMRATPGDAAQKTAEWASLRPEQVNLALRYYAEYQDEIDAWIRRNDEEAQRGYAEFLSK